MALIERQPARWPSAPLRSRGAVRFVGLHRNAEAAPSHHQHEPQGQPIRQRGLRILHEDLKYEEVYRNEYRDFHDAHASIGEFLERVYNQKRLHSASRVRSTGRVRERRHGMRSSCQLRNGGSAPATLGFNAVAPEWRSNGAADAAPAIPAAESTLGSHPCVALSSAQVLPEWTTSTSPCNDFSSNGDYPLNFVSHSRGSLSKGVEE